MHTNTVKGIRLVFEDPKEMPDVLVCSPNPRHTDYAVPFMADAGIPLFARNETERVIFRTDRKETYKIAQLMTDPDIGLSNILFQDFGGPLVPILMFRKDAVPFTVTDYYILVEFVAHIFNSDPPFHVSRRLWFEWAQLRAKNGMPLVPGSYEKKSYLLHDVITASISKQGIPKPPLLNSELVRLFYFRGEELQKQSNELSLASDMVQGVSVSGADVTAVEVPMNLMFDHTSVALPIAELVGLPVFAGLDKNAKSERHAAYRMVRLMREMPTGITKKGTCDVNLFRGLKPSFVFRSDGVPFTTNDLFVLYEFEAAMFDRCKTTASALPTKRDWLLWASEYVMRHDCAGVSVEDSVLLTEVKFPADAVVRLRGLEARTDLNNEQGIVMMQPCARVGRVRVKLDVLAEPISVKLNNVVRLVKRVSGSMEVD